jgi:hypothetical protein
VQRLQGLPNPPRQDSTARRAVFYLPWLLSTGRNKNDVSILVPRSEKPRKVPPLLGGFALKTNEPTNASQLQQTSSPHRPDARVGPFFARFWILKFILCFWSNLLFLAEDIRNTRREMQI